jgi:hypothetical protein
MKNLVFILMLLPMLLFSQVRTGKLEPDNILLEPGFGFGDGSDTYIEGSFQEADSAFDICSDTTYADFNLYIDTFSLGQWYLNFNKYSIKSNLNKYIMLKITVEIEFGISIEEAFIQTQELAKKLNVMVAFNYFGSGFNYYGIDCVSYPNGDSSTGVRNYNDIKEGKSDLKTANNK